MTIAARLAELGIVLPNPPAPVAAYVPFVQEGNILYVSGQIPTKDGKVLYAGKLSAGADIERGREAAKLCAINLLAQAQAALESLERVARVIKLGGFVACGPDFTDHPKIINGASELMQDIFGDNGRHARFAVGAPSLPLDAMVEVEAIFAVR